MTPTPDLLDTHAHLHFPGFDEDRDAVLARAVPRRPAHGHHRHRRRDVKGRRWHWPTVTPTCGPRPVSIHDAAESDEAAQAEVERIAAERRVVAIGEIGLDFPQSLPAETQERVLRAASSRWRGACASRSSSTVVTRTRRSWRCSARSGRGRRHHALLLG